MLGKVFGLDAIGWTAIGTIALTAVTGTYAFLTWRLAQSADRSVTAAERAAESAERTAAAALEASAISAAIAEVEFEASYVDFEHEDYPAGILRVGSRKGSVYIQSVTLDSVYWRSPSLASSDELKGQPCPITNPDEQSAYVYPGNGILCRWPGSHPVTDPEAIASLTVEFSFDRAGERRKRNVGVVWHLRPEESPA